MRKEYEQFDPSDILEGMTSIRALIHARDAGINARRIDKILYDPTCMKKIGKDIAYLRAVSEKNGYELIESNAEEISSLAIGNTHGGLIALCGSRPIPSLSACADQVIPCGFYAYIEGIEDPYNFGYALRSLYACGVNGIILGERNWYSASGVIARASAGASELLHVFAATTEDTIDTFHRLGYTIVAGDLRTEHELGKTVLQYPLLLVVGGEKRGISNKLLEQVDIKVKIPYAQPFHASLSAASAVTIFAYEIMRQNNKTAE